MSDACGRLIREVRDHQKHHAEEPEIKLRIEEDSLFKWTGQIMGPKDTPYEGGFFALRMICPQQYPMLPPRVYFITPVFHPNVHWTTGEICLDVLKSNWTPAWTLHSLCRALIILLEDPNADSPLNCDAGNLVRSGDLRGFNSLARMYTKEYAREEYLPSLE